MYFSPKPDNYAAFQKAGVTFRIISFTFLLLALLLITAQKVRGQGVIFQAADEVSHTFMEVSLSSAENNYILKQKRFIKELYYQQRYFDCIAETIRLCNSDKPVINNKDYKYFIEMNYFMGKQYKTVISHLSSANELNKNNNLLFLLAWSYAAIGLNNEGFKILKGLDFDQLQDNERVELFKNRAGLLLMNFRYNDLLIEFSNGSGYKSIEEFAGLKKDIELYSRDGEKAKWLSAAMSAVLPGSGQVYTGKIIHGLISLASVTATAYMAYRSRDDRSLSMTFVFFSGLFYAGNIYGAYNSAESYNYDRNNKFTDGMINKYNLQYNPEKYIDLRGMLE